MLKDFREFISRGNVIDLATAVIIGSAFTAIVNSLVNDIIMPVIGMLLQGLDFTALAFNVGDASLTYGNFIQAVINFLIIAFVVFLLVRAVNNIQKSFKKDEEEKPADPPEPSAEEKLLMEIRDLLKAQK
jgi:large conductance mechanosensitive channel